MTPPKKLDILKKKIRKVGKFAFEKLLEPCSFGWELVVDEDLKSLEILWAFAHFQSVWTKLIIYFIYFSLYILPYIEK